MKTCQCASNHGISSTGLCPNCGGTPPLSKEQMAILESFCGTTPPAPGPGSVSQAIERLKKAALPGVGPFNEPSTEVEKDDITLILSDNDRWARDNLILEQDLAAANGLNVRLRKVLELARDEMEARDLGVAELNAVLTSTAALGGFVAVEKDRYEALRELVAKLEELESWSWEPAHCDLEERDIHATARADIVVLKAKAGL